MYRCLCKISIYICVPVNIKAYYRVFIKKLWFFPRIVYILRPLLRQHKAVQKWSNNKSNCTLGSLARMSCSSTCRGWVVVNKKKKHNFIEHPVCMFR